VSPCLRTPLHRKVSKTITLQYSWHVPTFNISGSSQAGICKLDARPYTLVTVSLKDILVLAYRSATLRPKQFCIETPGSGHE
jgi:hypothetical protein